jgi:hypothetical protein
MPADGIVPAGRLSEGGCEDEAVASVLGAEQEPPLRLAGTVPLKRPDNGP